jgi:hypothetical protein
MDSDVLSNIQNTINRGKQQVYPEVIPEIIPKVYHNESNIIKVFGTPKYVSIETTNKKPWYRYFF